MPFKLKLGYEEEEGDDIIYKLFNEAAEIENMIESMPSQRKEEVCFPIGLTITLINKRWGKLKRLILNIKATLGNFLLSPYIIFRLD